LELCADRPPPASLYQTYFQKLNSFTITQLNEFIRVLNTQMGLSIRTTQAKKADIVLRCVLFPRTCHLFRPPPKQWHRSRVAATVRQ
jgi:hypothetical protein